MKKCILLFLLIFLSNTASSQLPPWIKAAENWVNQAAKDVNKSFKEVENVTQNAVAETKKATEDYTKEIENFSVKLIDEAKNLINNISKDGAGNFCHNQVDELYKMVNPLIKNEIDKLKINVTSNGSVNTTSTELTKKTAKLCVECTQYALKTFLCRLPESIQNNIAFMDKIKSAMNNPEVLKVQPASLRPVAALGIMVKEDFVNQFKTNFELLKKVQEEIEKNNGGRGLDVYGLTALYSKEVCDELGNMAFDAMVGALKGKEDPNKIKKRYEILLDKVKKLFKDAKDAIKELKVVKKGEAGYEKYLKMKGYYDNAATIYSFTYPIGGIKNVSIPKSDPIFSVGSNGNIFVNATGNGLWSDGRNWSKQMVPMSYQTAYIPKGKTVNVNRPTKVRDVINNNDNNAGISGKNNISYTKNSKYLAGYTFAIKNKKSNTYMAVAGDSKNNGGNLISYTNNPTHDTRNFTFLDSGDGDGSYIMVSKWSGLLIGVKGGFTFENALIEQWKDENRPNQRVFLDEASNGYYKIRFKHTNMYLGFKDCNGTIGAKFVQVKEPTDNDCILFQLESASLSGKTFMIQSKVDNNKYLDKSMSGSDNKIHLWQKNGNPNQKFYFRLAEVDKKTGQEYYYIRNLNNYQYLINYSYGVMNGTPIATTKDPGFNDWATMYYLEKYDDNYYYIRSRFGKNVNGKWESDRCIDINGGSSNNGTKVQLWNCSPGFNGQLFKLIEQ